MGGRNATETRLTFLSQPKRLVLFLTGRDSQPSNRVSVHTGEDIRTIKLGIAAVHGGEVKPEMSQRSKVW